MTIIETVGVPCSGKTTNYFLIKSKLKKRGKISYNYSELFFIFSHKIRNLTINEKLSLKLSYKIYKRYNKNSNLKFVKNNKKKILDLNYPKTQIKSFINNKVKNIKKKIIFKLGAKEKKLFSILKKSVSSSPLNYHQKKILNSRIEEEIIGLHIYKKLNLSKYIILNDEGIIQRILSGIKNHKMIFKNLNFFYSHFKIDKVLYVRCSYSDVFRRSNLRNKGFKYNNLKNNSIKTWLNVFDEYFKKYKDKNILKVNKNLSKITDKIILIK